MCAAALHQISQGRGALGSWDDGDIPLYGIAERPKFNDFWSIFLPISKDFGKIMPVDELSRNQVSCS